MENSLISWTTHTFNPWMGCAKVSPGCAHCYAEREMDHRHHRVQWGPGQPRVRTGADNWKKPVRWNREAGMYPDACAKGHRLNADAQRQIGNTLCPAQYNAQGKFDPQNVPPCGAPILLNVRPRVFSASIADWLDDEAPIDWLADLLQLVHDTPNLDWLLLTKRPENWRERLSRACVHIEMTPPPGDGRPELATLSWLHQWLGEDATPSNIWFGVTAENQAMADRRIPLLLDIPARVRFLSCEPLLGPIDLRYPAFNGADSLSSLAGIHWVIAGGESGPHARPMHPEWARSLRDQCAQANIPFHFKQWGEWWPISQMPNGTSDQPWIKGRPSTVLQLDGSQEFAFPPGAMTCYRVGVRASRRLLDGLEHNAFPVRHTPVATPSPRGEGQGEGGIHTSHPSHNSHPHP